MGLFQAHGTGQRVMAEMSNARVEHGQGRLPLDRVPYPVDPAVKALENFEHLILVNAKAPVGFFAYPGKPSKHYPESAEVHVLSRYEQDPELALQEFKSSKYILDHLKKLPGLEITYPLSKTGIKAVSDGGGVNWNPWHGCHKISSRCQNCYV